MKKSISFCLVFLFLLSGIIFAQERSTSEYKIAVNDLLEISVYEEPDLTKTVRVSAEGAISYPLLGNIQVKGLTSKELETKITEMLARDYLVNPNVAVLVKEHSKVSVLGQVREPGSYELKGGGLTLMDAIALAGGFTEKANTEDVKLVRVKGDEKETISVNAKDIMENNDKSMDVALQAGDLVIISELSDTAQYVVVLGQVKGPGRYAYKKGMTLIEAIALAGGLSETAAANGTRIIRTEESGKRVIPIALGSILQGGGRGQDITLQPEDTIVVPESFF